MDKITADASAILEDLRKWAKYGKILSGVIHNLNTPLMGITGRIELISFKMPDLKGLDQITKQLDSINDILSSIAFMVDKDTNVEPLVMDLKELLDKINSFMRANMKYKHRLDVVLNLQESIIIDTIPCYLQNAVVEILENALDLCDDDKTINIESGLDGRDALVRISHDGKQIPVAALLTLDEIPEEYSEKDPVNSLRLAKYYTKKINARLDVNNVESGVVYELRIPMKKGKEK